tara:strand:- start:2731 stop:3564 length:834 start_codon:yes stop_codon:yes gene_type:complete
MKVVGFTKHNPGGHGVALGWPEEDFFKYSRKKGKVVVAVADGITRDPIGLIDGELPNLKSLIGEVEMALEYPIPSPARKSAEVFCERFVKKGEVSKKGFEKVNAEIWKLNKGLDVDYLENDFAGCVASAGVIEGKELKYGYVADCGVCVFDKKGKLKFRTDSEGPGSGIEKAIGRKFDWSKPEFRKKVRKEFRNNIKKKEAYGAFTGEKEVMDFLRIGKVDLEEGDYVLFYSDGFVELIYSKKFDIVKKFDELEEYFEKKAEEIVGNEGTLICVLVD